MRFQSLTKATDGTLYTTSLEGYFISISDNEFKLEKCIQESFSLLSAYAREKGIELIYEIDNNLPSLLIGDADRLRQILINLVNNGLKFSEEGAVKVTVISLDKTDKNIKLQFSVKDNGIGI